ncbi:hypothetical protein CKA32_001851 [Geitlerinema sp. FC II]|nr:hypothetical protein CKA32_001851 [Geitlerinema sp. FC II]
MRGGRETNRRQSPVTSRQSPVTSHQSPVTSHQWQQLTVSPPLPFSPSLSSFARRWDSQRVGY